jgi:hypothetical protein
MEVGHGTTTGLFGLCDAQAVLACAMHTQFFTKFVAWRRDLLEFYAGLNQNEQSSCRQTQE